MLVEYIYFYWWMHWMVIKIVIFVYNLIEKIKMESNLTPSSGQDLTTNP